MKVELTTAEAARGLFSNSPFGSSLSHAADAITLVLDRDGAATGVLQLERLAFDSELFGVSSARINVLTAQSEADYTALLAACQSECRARGVRHVVRRMPVGQFAETWGLAGAGYRLVDVSVLFERAVAASGSSSAESSRFRVRPVEPAEAAALAARYAAAFTLTRFAVDPFVSVAAALELHRRWIVNSCQGRADAVLVADVGSELLGFITCRLDQATATGCIELVAVDAAQRGAGIGRGLVGAALTWFAGRAERVQVRTQLNNSIAVGLYQASGFRLLLGELTYAWMDEAKDPQ